MTTILLTGTPRSGKTSLVEVTQEFCRRYYEKRVLSISMADLVAEAAHDRFYTPPERVCYIEPEMQGTLRYGAISEAGRRLLLSKEEHIIVDTPMTMYVKNGLVLDQIFSSRDIDILHGSKPIDVMVTLLEDPYLLAQRLAGTPYPVDVSNLLDWMVAEVQNTANARDQISAHCRKEDLPAPRHLIIPRHYSDETLAKLLNDSNPTVCYLARPMSHLFPARTDSAEIREQRKEARERIKHFQERLQEYAIVVAPIELADFGVSEEEKAHTVFRDKQWFVANSDLVIAYFPDDYASEGSKEEMRANLRMGKPVVLIHPRADKEVFGIRPTFYFRTEEEFFAAVQESRYDQRYSGLQGLLDPRQDLPRYAHLRSYAVAVDLRSGEKHLLQQQGLRNDFTGKWMLVAGKKDSDQTTDFEALHREAWEEVGVRLSKISLEYKIYPVDYAHESVATGIKPKYVRVYTANEKQWQGQPVRNNYTDTEEVSAVGFFTREQILAMGNEGKVVPATLKYFREMGIVVENNKSTIFPR